MPGGRGGHYVGKWFRVLKNEVLVHLLGTSAISSELPPAHHLELDCVLGKIT